MSSPLEAPFYRKGRWFSFQWVYRQIYNSFLTNQSALFVSVKLWHSFLKVGRTVCLIQSLLKWKYQVSFKSQMNFNSTRFGLVHHNLNVVVVVVVFFFKFCLIFFQLYSIFWYGGLSQHYSSGKIRSPVVARSDQRNAQTVARLPWPPFTENKISYDFPNNIVE